MRRSWLNRFIRDVAAHLALSTCWLVGCLPLVTAPVATAALFEVARLRTRGQEPAIGRSFLVAFRQYLRPASVIGLGWAALGGLLVADLAIVAELAPPGGGVLRVALLALLLLYLLSSVSLFPVLVSYHARPDRLARTAVLVTLRFPGRAGSGLVAVAAAGAVGWLVPVSIVLTPSLVATAVHRLYRGGLDRVGTRAAPPVHHHPAGRPVPSSGPAVPAPS